MPEIRVLDPQEAPAVRRLIYTIAHLTFGTGRTLEEDIADFSHSWDTPDLYDIQGSYFDNGGTFLAVWDGAELIGTGAFRRLAAGVCELKRFWFLPAYHGTGIAHTLLARLLELARAAGYHTMRLETSRAHQQRAVAFYTKHGFHEIPNYSGHPDGLAMERPVHRAILP